MTKRRTIFALIVTLIMVCNSVQPAYAVSGKDTKTKAANTAIQELHNMGINLDKSNKSNLEKTMTDKLFGGLMACHVSMNDPWDIRFCFFLNTNQI